MEGEEEGWGYGGGLGLGAWVLGSGLGSPHLCRREARQLGAQ